MKIGMITQWFDPETGSAAIPGSIVRALEARGHEVHVVTGFPNYPYGRLYDGYRIRLLQRDRIGRTQVSRVPNFPSHDASGVRRALTYLAFMVTASTIGAFLLRRAEIVLVYSTSATVGLAGVASRLLFGRRYVLYIQDLWPDSVLASGMVRGPAGRIAESVLHGLCDLGYRFASDIAVISPGLRNVLIERGVPAEKITVIHNWVDEDVFAPIQAEATDRTTFDVMYAGSIGEVQGLDVAVEAISMSPAHIRLRLVGGGVAEEALRERAAALGLADRVLFEGSKPLHEMPSLMASADVQLVCLRDIPLFAATMPSKTQAILASGLPAVVSAPGDVARLVSAAGAGLAVKPEDPAALARAFTELSALSPADLSDLGQAGRTYYEAELCSEVGAERLERVMFHVREESK